MESDGPRPRTTWKRRILWGSLIAAFLAFLLWFGLSLVLTRAMTSRATPLYPEPPPTDLWPSVETLQLETSDGERLGAWFVPGEGDGPVVVLLHGNGGDRSVMVGHAQLLVDLGASVLAPTLRAHGDSTGDRNDIGYSARHDVIAAVAWAESRCPGRPVVVQGYSMGAAAAAFAADALGDRVSGYILEAPYRDLHRAVRHRTRRYLPPVVEYMAYAGLVAASWVVLPQADRISPERAVSAVPHEVPVLIIAGGADSRAPPGDARALFEQVRSHGRLEIIEGAEHESITSTDPQRYRELIRSVLDDL